jgi:hypothetical protein
VSIALLFSREFGAVRLGFDIENVGRDQRRTVESLSFGDGLPDRGLVEARSDRQKAAATQLIELVDELVGIVDLDSPLKKSVRMCSLLDVSSAV